jgi:hypothetical protein
MLGDLFDGERLVGVGHDGLDDLGAGFEVARPVEGLGGGAVAAEVDVEVQLGLRFDRLRDLVFRTEVADVIPFFLSRILQLQIGRKS